VSVRAVDHGVAVELELHTTPDRWDRVAVWLLPGGELIDSGGALTALELLAHLRRSGRVPQVVFLGHWHEDHSGGAAELARAGLTVLAGRGTGARLRRPPGVPAYRSRFWGGIEPVRTQIPPAAGPLRPVPLPGHSPDQLGYLDERTGVLFSGDVAVRRFQRIGMPGESPHAMIDSIRRVLDLGPAALATSHRGLLTGWRGYLEEQLAYLEDVRGRARELRRQGRSIQEIVVELYGGEARTPDGREWRAFTAGEFSTARWVATLIRDPGSEASSRSSPPPRPPSGPSPPT
jgi:endoribonuclease LACTB2